MFKNYDKTIFEKFDGQHNIFILVGNGFDISVLKKFPSARLPGKTTSYNDFFNYITYFDLVDESNILFKKMKKDMENGKENWSDFEYSIGEIIKHGYADADAKRLEKSIDEFQNYFTKFLNDLVDSKVLLDLNHEVSKNKLSNQSFGMFLKDLADQSEVKFKEQVSHYHLLNFVIANFNYTSLLDNYLHLDKNQFDPHKHKSVDTNFQFYVGQTRYLETIYSTYIISDVIHPHGWQSIPRSILFGTYLERYDKGRGIIKRFVKEYWSQYEVKYKSYIEEANLFIIYGMSLGNSDAWWLDNIFDSLKNKNTELIIYMHGNQGDAEVKELFINSCIRNRNCNNQVKNRVKKNIHVVTFQENNTYFLGLEKK